MLLNLYLYLKKLPTNFRKAISIIPFQYDIVIIWVLKLLYENSEQNLMQHICIITNIFSKKNCQFFLK